MNQSENRNPNLKAPEVFFSPPADDKTPKTRLPVVSTRTNTIPDVRSVAVEAIGGGQWGWGRQLTCLGASLASRDAPLQIGTGRRKPLSGPKSPLGRCSVRKRSRRTCRRSCKQSHVTHRRALIGRAARNVAGSAGGGNWNYFQRIFSNIREFSCFLAPWAQNRQQFTFTSQNNVNCDVSSRPHWLLTAKQLNLNSKSWKFSLKFNFMAFGPLLNKNQGVHL